MGEKSPKKREKKKKAEKKTIVPISSKPATKEDK